MKKIITIILLLLVITGCVNMNNLSADDAIDMVFNEKIAKANTAMEGYKIYLPKSMTIHKDKKSNNVIYSNNEKYYLYVDLISYYNKTNNEYEENQNTSIYSKQLDYNKKKGYITVTEKDQSYFVEVVYNYGKIEVITNNYEKAITKSLIILRSIKFNDKVIESLIGNNKLSYDEEEFNLEGPNVQTDNFLKYEENDIYEDVDNELPDEDIIDIKDNQ